MDKMKIIFYNKANEQRPAARGAFTEYKKRSQAIDRIVS